MPTPHPQKRFPARVCHGAKWGRNWGIWVLAEFSKNKGIPAADLVNLISKLYQSLVGGTKRECQTQSCL